MEGGQEWLSYFARNERVALRGRKLRMAVAGIRARRRAAASSFGQTCQIEDVMSVILKTRPEMTLAGVGATLPKALPCARSLRLMLAGARLVRKHISMQGMLHLHEVVRTGGPS